MLFGTDPEFFSGYLKEDGKLYVLPPVFFRKNLGVSFIENGRHPIFLHGDNGLIIHEDGAAFEMSLSPSTDWRQLWNEVNAGKKLLEERILNKFSDYCEPTVFTVPTIGYEVERWIDEDDDFKYCVQFGCDPDRDAFDTERECKVLDASTHDKRYGGGHIHISGEQVIQENPISAIHSLALTAGLAAVAFSDTPELDRDRTFLYGKPGKFRIQNYRKEFNGIPYSNMGVEYRTPSNRWTANMNLAEKVFYWAEVGINVLLKKDLLSEVLGTLRTPATNAILECNQSLAAEILNYISERI